MLDMVEQTLDLDKPVFLDTETCTNEGYTKEGGGLYGTIRLVQIYQAGWSQAFIIDCVFIDVHRVFNMLLPYHQVWHNASYDLHTYNLVSSEPYIPAKIDDTLYMARLTLYKKTSRFGFYLCLKALKLNDSHVDGMDKTENQRADWGGVLTKVMKKYAACDVLYLSLLYEQVKHATEMEAYQLDMFNLKYALEYSRRGIPVDQGRIQGMLRKTMLEYEETINYLHPLNPNSPKQVCEFLGTSSSNMDTLVNLKLQGNEDAGKIRDARQLSKTITFLKRYDRPIIKGFYSACGAITGRMSCTGGDRYDHANTQQIPRRILRCLMASEGRTLVYADYSGLELRMGVAWIGEPTMLGLMMDGIDVHSHTGSILYKKPAEELTDFERMVGKICNFLLIYAGSPNVLQATIRSWGGILMDMSEVRKIYDSWFEAYPYFKEWHNMNKKMLNVYGYVDVHTALGRQVRATSLNDAVNIPIQGSSSEVTKTSLRMLKTRYPDENLISTIHDSNTLMPLIEESELWVDRLNECMIDAWYEVIQHTEVPNLPMPPDAKVNTHWDFGGPE